MLVIDTRFDSCERDRWLGLSCAENDGCKLLLRVVEACSGLTHLVSSDTTANQGEKYNFYVATLVRWFSRV